MLITAACQCPRRQVLRALYARPQARFTHDSHTPSASAGDQHIIVSSKNTDLPIIEIPKSSIYAPGDPNTVDPILRDVSLTVQPHEAWAVLSAGYGASKRTLFKALLGSRRLHPYPPRGIFPFLGYHPPEKHVWFTGNVRGRKGGEFFDYTARYGAMRDGDGRTLREEYFPDLVEHAPSRHHDLRRERRVQRLWNLVRELNLEDLLDIPLVALSNGQTRRARMARTLLMQPALVIMDEPLSEFLRGTALLAHTYDIHSRVGRGEPCHASRLPASKTHVHRA